MATQRARASVEDEKKERERAEVIEGDAARAI